MQESCEQTHKCPLTLVVSHSIYMTMKTSVLLSVCSRSECVYCAMFLPDVVIPESPEAYVKLTEQTLRSSTGRQQQTKMTSALQRRHTGLVDLCSFLLCTSRCDRQQHFLTPRERMNSISSISSCSNKNRDGIQPRPSFVTCFLTFI